MVEQASSQDDPFGWVGETLEGRYAVEKVVGEGGFAVVYRGHHKGLDGAVAIKCLKIPRKLAGEERERFLQSFLDEGKLLHRLSRANVSIVQALDVGATNSPKGSWTPYLVLEWLEGETLEEDLRRRARADEGGRSIQEALALLEPAASALATAHAQGIAHRDIKPANLFLCTVAGKRVLKVVDFGIAKVIGESTDLQRAHEATGMSLHAFSPRYGAPEQFDRRFGATGPWTDVFALALVFVEVVAGHAPMQGDSAQLFVAASNAQHRPTLRAHDIDPGDAVEVVLLRALAVDPKERYATAQEFWDALKTAATTTIEHPTRLVSSSGEGRGGGAVTRPARPVDPLAPTIPSLPGHLIQAPPSITTGMAAVDEALRPPAPKSPFVWLSVAACAACAAIGGGWWLMRPPSETRAPTVSSASSTAPLATPGQNHLAAASTTPPSPSSGGAELPPIACTNGLVPYVDTAIGYALCIPDELRDTTAIDGIIRKGDLELKVDGGPLQPPETTLDAMFDRDRADDAESGRSILPGKTEKTADSFSLTGTVQGKPFFERTVTTTDRFARFRLIYPASDRKALEPKLAHMLPSFIIAANKTAR